MINSETNSRFPMATASIPLFLQPRTPVFQFQLRLRLRLKPSNSIINERSSSPLNSGCSNIAVQHFPSEGLSPARKSGWSRQVSAAAEEALHLDATPVEGSSPELVSVGDDGVSTIIQILLFAAFVGLSILSIGVIYIAVTDFLQKREREKFEKEEASKVKKGGKKGKVSRARTGPRGFGQRLDSDESDD